ncbi:helix-turn-helix domain-containing protein, partial [Pseudoalteromonas sp. NBT06-2]|uniref:helix-turn-helix domain-containing protein n=1 Tax=Pseudoalteromonas sp. NBT06-2 TaxID=2025950 RepID=UPI001482A6A5
MDIVLERLKQEFNVKSDRALSDKLGLSTSGISMSRSKKALPYAAIVKTCAKYSVSTDNIFGIKLDNSENKRPQSLPNTVISQPKGLTAKDLLAVNTMVDKVLK